MSRSWIILFLIVVCVVFVGCGDDLVKVAPLDDDPSAISLSRLAWSWASAPVHGQDQEYVLATGDARDFEPEDRIETIRWFLPRERVLARYLDPELVNEARDETVYTLDLYLRAEDGTWDAEDWGGIMTGAISPDLMLTDDDFLDVWINDHRPDPDMRSGTLHIDLGMIDEDGFFPPDGEGGLESGTFQQEDGILSGEPDGVWVYDEDVGLDGDEFGLQRYSSDYEIDGDSPYPRINGTARNNREDTEDLDGNGVFDRDNQFLTCSIDLRETEPMVDVLADYDSPEVQELIEAKIAWRRYRIPLGDLLEVGEGKSPGVTFGFPHLRIWFEDENQAAASVTHLQIAGLRFVKYE